MPPPLGGDPYAVPATEKKAYLHQLLFQASEEWDESAACVSSRVRSAFLFLYAVYIRARPILIELAESAVTDVVVFAVNDVIDETLAEGDLDYSNLVTLEKAPTATSRRLSPTWP